LDAEPTRNRAEVALMFGVSRARVTQHLNLIKLPSGMVDYLADRTDSRPLSHFTERRLRPMAMKADKAEVITRFSTTVAEIRQNAAERVSREQRRGA